MTAPRIGSIPLVDENAVSSSGGAFLLSTQAKSNEVLRFDDAEIEVHAHEPFAVVRFSGSEDAVSTFSDAHRLVQQGLDMLSILGKQDSVILDAENEHHLCWTEPSGKVVRTVSTTLLEFNVGAINAVIKDKDGNVIPSVPTSPQHHPAFRYYRLAQTTDDLFDAYRNMYLAFEVLLSSHYPKIKGEHEIDWLRRALSAATVDTALISLKTERGADEVENIINAIYKDARLPLFHAKEGLAFYMPQDSGARTVVSSALNILTQLVLRMAEKWYSARRMGGGLFFGWVYDNVRTVLSSSVIYVSNYSGSFNADERDLSHPRFKSAVTAPCTLMPELERGKEPALMATFIG